MTTSTIKLTSFSHGGGCGCKIAPGVLAEILKNSHGFSIPPQLLVGIENSDDAAVYKLNDEQALIATTDFFMPIVDDPFDFGRIAATNAISDVYAMGGTPIMALALVGMPINKLPTDVIGQILKGGETICSEAGIPIAGGHTIDSVEPIYGLVVLGLVHPSKIKRNGNARAGEQLILGKGLGIGILSAALKKGQLNERGYDCMIRTTTQLNKPGAALANMAGIGAVTDVTGFGLLGHLLEVTRASRLTARLSMKKVPVLDQVMTLTENGCVTGASERNWAAYGHEVTLSDGIYAAQKNLLTDPQTSGGLLVSVNPEAVADVLQLFHSAGFQNAAVIGEFVEQSLSAAEKIIVTP
jgi:selenide,water dikinase